MGISDISRPAIPGVLDSDAIVPGRPMAAHFARAIARTANHMRDAEAMILNAAWVVPAANRWSPPRLNQLLAAWAECPVRPSHREATVRLRALAPAGTVIVWGVRGAGGRVEVEQTGTGSVALLSGTLPLSTDLDTATIELWVRATAGTAAPTGDIGTPNSWSLGTTTTVITRQTIEVSTASWTTAELSSGGYWLSLFDAATQTIWEREIVDAFASGQINFSPPLTRAEIDATRAVEAAGGGTMEIRTAGGVALQSLTVLGRPS